MAKKPSKSFNKLKDTWYAKLKKSGFEDIEQDEENLKFWSCEYTRKYKATQHGGWQIKAEYYSMAGRFLHEYKFSTEFEKTLWEYHASGLSIREIVKILEKLKIRGVKRTSLWKIIKRLETSMKNLYLVPLPEVYDEQ